MTIDILIMKSISYNTGNIKTIKIIAFVMFFNGESVLEVTMRKEFKNKEIIQREKYHSWY